MEQLSNKQLLDVYSTRKIFFYSKLFKDVCNHEFINNTEKQLKVLSTFHMSHIQFQRDKVSEAEVGREAIP